MFKASLSQADIFVGTSTSSFSTLAYQLRSAKDPHRARLSSFFVEKEYVQRWNRHRVAFSVTTQGASPEL